MNEKLQEQYKKYKENREKITFYYLYPDNFEINKHDNSAIVVPIDNNKHNLNKFTSNEVIKKFPDRIYLFEQSGSKKINKGMLFNIACKELLNNYERLILHDINFLPNSELEKYYLYSGDSLIHLSGPETCNLTSDNDFFGGVLSVGINDFVKVNGFPNDCFGTGGEDNIFYDRVAKEKLKVFRANQGKYTVLEYANLNSEVLSSFSKEIELKHSKMKTNLGLSDIDYNIVSIENHSNYNKYQVNF